MSTFLSQSTVDVTFNAWWDVYGRTPGGIQRALAKTIVQINGEPIRRPNGPLPPRYQPPPVRNPPKRKPRVQRAGGGQAKPRLTAKQKRDAAKGVKEAEAQVARQKLDDIRKIQLRVLREQNLTIPENVARTLSLLGCYRDPADRLRAEREIFEAYAEDIHNANVNAHQYKEQLETAHLQRMRRRRMLKDLDWLVKNPIGAGTYGAHMEGGASHDDAMEIAKDTQSIMDLADQAVIGPANTRAENAGRTHFDGKTGKWK